MGCRNSVDAAVPSQRNIKFKQYSQAKVQVKIQSGASSLKKTYRIGE